MKLPTNELADSRYGTVWHCFSFGKLAFKAQTTSQKFTETIINYAVNAVYRISHA